MKSLFGLSCLFGLFGLLWICWGNWNRNRESFATAATAAATATATGATKVWSSDLTRRFEGYMKNVHPDQHVNMEVLRGQVTPAEAEEYLKTGRWQWSNALKQMYMDEVSKSTLVQTSPIVALSQAMQLYNGQAALEMIAWRQPEGAYLLAHCDKEGVLNTTKGVSFLSSSLSPSPSQCNPCDALRLPLGRFDCPFVLQGHGHGDSSSSSSSSSSMSAAWKELWGL